MTSGRTLKRALNCKGLPANSKEWRAIAEDRSEWRSRTYSKPMPPGFMRVRVKMDFASRKRTLSPVRLVLENSIKRSFMLFVLVSLQLGSIILSNLIEFNFETRPCSSRHHGTMHHGYDWVMTMTPPEAAYNSCLNPKPGC
jgi:hypothetical protein